MKTQLIDYLSDNVISEYDEMLSLNKGDSVHLVDRQWEVYFKRFDVKKTILKIYCTQIK